MISLPDSNTEIERSLLVSYMNGSSVVDDRISRLPVNVRDVVWTYLNAVDCAALHTVHCSLMGDPFMYRAAIKAISCPHLPRCKSKDKTVSEEMIQRFFGTPICTRPDSEPFEFVVDGKLTSVVMRHSSERWYRPVPVSSVRNWPYVVMFVLLQTGVVEAAGDYEESNWWISLILAGFILEIVKCFLRRYKDSICGGFSCILSCIWGFFTWPYRWLTTKPLMAVVPESNALGMFPRVQIIARMEDGRYWARTAEGIYGYTVAFDAESSEAEMPKFEMAIPGSSLVEPESNYVGYICTVTDGTMRVVGSFFRVNDFLVTAYHVARAGLFDPTDPDHECFGSVEFVGTKRVGGKLYLDVGVDSNAKRIRYRDLKRWNDNRPDHTDKLRRLKEHTSFGNCNEIPTDKYICYMPPQFWSRMGLRTMSFQRPVVGECISVSGYSTSNARVMSAHGDVMSINEEEISYACTTHPGWSGSPVCNRGSVYAVHSCAKSTGKSGVNIGRTLWNILPYLARVEESELDFDVDTGTLMIGGRQLSLDAEDYWLSGTKERAVYGTFPDGKQVYLNDMDNLAVECAERWGIDELEATEILEEYCAGRMNRKRLNRHTGNQFENAPVDIEPVKKVKKVTFSQRTATGKDLPAVVAEKKTKKKKRKNNKQKMKEPAETPETSVDEEAVETPAFVKIGSSRPIPVVPVSKQSNLTSEEIALAKENGYDAKAFQQPTLNAKNEEKSFVEAFKGLKESRHKYHKRCAAVVLAMIKKFKFVINPDLRDPGRIKQIIDTRLKGKSSPGRWYKLQGYNTNSDLLAARPDFHEEVIQNWDVRRHLRYFNKNEPHKESKIKSGLLRGIYSCSVDELVRDNSIFNELLSKLEDEKNFLQTPMFFAWSHQAAGNAQALADYLDFDPNCEVAVSSDKARHDVHVTGTSVDMIVEIIRNLGVSPNEEIQRIWREEAERSIRSVFENCEVALSNGDIYRQSIKGIVKSGKLLTWFINTLNQLIDHVEALLTMGVPEKDIIENDLYRVAIFGDDAANIFPKNFDRNRYREIIHSITPIGDWHEHANSLEGFEFCSNVFVKIDGKWGMKPVRFTKHVMNYHVMDPKDRKQALQSYLRDYCYDIKRWNFWLQLYINAGYDVSDVSTPQEYRLAREGYEGA